MSPSWYKWPLANQRACVLVSPLWSVNPSNPFWERPYLHDNTIVLVSIVDLLLQFVVVWNISACNKPPRREGLATFYAKWIAFCAVYFFVRSGISDLKPITFINTRVEWRSTLMRTVHGPTCHKDICQNPNNVFAVIVLVSFTTLPLLPVYLARE